MAERQYRNAPIAEGLIDLQVEFPEPFDQKRFEEAATTLSHRFPNRNVIRQFEMNIADVHSGGSPVVKTDAEVGMRLATADGQRILQIQQRGFTYSHLPPYTNWAGFSSEAKDLWAWFAATLKPTAVTRAAVRYINRIVVPAEQADFDKYFTLYPKLPESVAATVTGCFMQTITPQPALGEQASAVINFGLEPAPSLGSLSFLLDFDVFSTCRIEPNSEEVWTMLNHFRARKNDLFEASITDAARELFQ